MIRVDSANTTFSIIVSKSKVMIGILLKIFQSGHFFCKTPRRFFDGVEMRVQEPKNFLFLIVEISRSSRIRKVE